MRLQPSSSILPSPHFSRPFNNAGRYIVWRGCISCGEWTVVMSVVMLVDKFGGWESSCCTTVPRRILTETLRNRRRRRRSINRDKTRFHERYPGGRGTGGWRSRETSLDVVGWKSWRRKGGRIDIYIYISTKQETDYDDDDETNEWKTLSISIDGWFRKIVWSKKEE